MTDQTRETHWNTVYKTKGDAEVSWFEESPEVSMALIHAAAVGPNAIAIDVGGGASRLVDRLLAEGHGSITVLDLSAEALALARQRNAAAGDRVRWVVGDITAWAPDRAYDLWHDRAAFHFLTEPGDQAAYAGVLSAALAQGGAAIIGTFAQDGPEKCSGLPVARHDGASIAAVLGDGFRLEGERRHEHLTPWGSMQKFQFSTFRKL